VTAADRPGGLEQRIRALGPWFHNLVLDGVATAPDHFLGDYPAHKFHRFAGALPGDLTGKTVLDVGCNAGFYAFEMKRRGAAHVVAVDSDPRYLAQARLAAEVLGHDIELRELDVYRVGELGARFDLVIFMGVLYHLRHPLLSDRWPGLETFFAPGAEILVADSTEAALAAIELPHATLARIGCRARARVFEDHSATQRAAELIALLEASAPSPPAAGGGGGPGVQAGDRRHPRVTRAGGAGAAARGGRPRRRLRSGRVPQGARGARRHGRARSGRG
jgi:SAM-dependent methyltransferase